MHADRVNPPKKSKQARSRWLLAPASGMGGGMGAYEGVGAMMSAPPVGMGVHGSVVPLVSSKGALGNSGNTVRVDDGTDGVVGDLDEEEDEEEEEEEQNEA